MQLDQIRARHAEIIQRYGAWTNHNIQLAADLYTISPRPTGADPKLRRYCQIIADHLLQGDRTWQDLRILDLACLEGIYGLEMALQGATVVAIEGREANLVKAKFVQEVLDLANIEFWQADVRHLSVEQYGKFDAVICVGILYHLDQPDLFEFLSQIAAVTQGIAIIDTQMAPRPETKITYGGQDYWGRVYLEHEPSASSQEKLNKLWASLDNPYSFWLTRPSLHNYLASLGFTSIYECHHPAVLRYEQMRAQEDQDRATLVAIKGNPVKIQANDLPLPDHTWQAIEALNLA